MKVAVLRERREAERRVAVTPETTKKLTELGLQVAVESGAGVESHHTDADYEIAGAIIGSNTSTVLANADIVLAVQRPQESEIKNMSSGSLLIGLFDPLINQEDIRAYAQAGIITFSLEFIPRITRAQSMDVLSSQSSLAGYCAVIDAASLFDRAFPLMMTAAGTIPPAKVFVLGAGVAGLQAIATARRLGAIVMATDVRAIASEQVESLGATFIAPPNMENMETAGGYAKEIDQEMKRQQSEIIADTLKKTDLAICTALVPGRRAPVLIDDGMIKDMRHGSIIVDLAVEQGGNCTLSQAGKVIEAHGVRIIGYQNVPSRIAMDASSQYARNLLHFLSIIVKDGSVSIDWEDEIIKSTLITHNGKVVHNGPTN